MSSQISIKEGKKNLKGRSVYVSGQSRFENELIAFFLKEIGIQCELIENPFNVDTKHIKSSNKDVLILTEYPNKDIESFLIALEKDNGDIVSRHLLALFNIDQGKGIEEKLLTLGIKGIFYKDDPLERFQKGIGAIFKGELWVSREVLTKYVKENIERDKTDNQDEKLLTHREIEILAMISAGTKNEDIADKLCISPNTVKTHIYNIFKKISVPNRLQAALWAAKNI